MYTTDDYENNKWSEPLTMILIGTTNILLKQSVKNCIQIMFSFNNKKKIKQLSNVPKYKNKSMNYNLMLCLLAWAKLDNSIDYVTIEAVSWASQSQSEKLGFEILRPNIVFPKNTQSRQFDENMVKNLINIISYSNKTFNYNNLMKKVPVNKLSDPNRDMNIRKLQAFLMQYKNDNETEFINQNGEKKSLKTIIHEYLRKGSRLANSSGAKYAGNAVLNSIQYINGIGYVPCRGNCGAHFSHFFDLSNNNKMIHNEFYINYQRIKNTQ